jgi:hypothetical protein
MQKAWMSSKLAETSRFGCLSLTEPSWHLAYRGSPESAVRSASGLARGVDARSRAPLTPSATEPVCSVASPKSTERREVRPADITSIEQAETIPREERARLPAALFGVMISREIVHGTARSTRRLHEPMKRTKDPKIGPSQSSTHQRRIIWLVIAISGPSTA